LPLSFIEFFLFYLKVPANGECQKIFGTEEIEKNGLPKFLLDTQMPNGLTKELTCLENQFGVEKACVVQTL